jgi:hypothetical protein
MEQDALIIRNTNRELTNTLGRAPTPDELNAELKNRVRSNYDPDFVKKTVSSQSDALTPADIERARQLETGFRHAKSIQGELNSNTERIEKLRGDMVTSNKKIEELHKQNDELKIKRELANAAEKAKIDAQIQKNSTEIAGHEIDASLSKNDIEKLNQRNEKLYNNDYMKIHEVDALYVGDAAGRAFKDQFQHPLDPKALDDPNYKGPSKASEWTEDPSNYSSRQPTANPGSSSTTSGTKPDLANIDDPTRPTLSDTTPQVVQPHEVSNAVVAKAQGELAQAVSPDVRNHLEGKLQDPTLPKEDRTAIKRALDSIDKVQARIAAGELSPAELKKVAGSLSKELAPVGKFSTPEVPINQHISTVAEQTGSIEKLARAAGDQKVVNALNTATLDPAIAADALDKTPIEKLMRAQDLSSTLPEAHRTAASEALSQAIERRKFDLKDLTTGANKEQIFSKLNLNKFDDSTKKAVESFVKNDFKETTQGVRVMELGDNHVLVVKAELSDKIGNSKLYAQEFKNGEPVGAMNHMRATKDDTGAIKLFEVKTNTLAEGAPTTAKTLLKVTEGKNPVYRSPSHYRPVTVTKADGTTYDLCQGPARQEFIVKANPDGTPTIAGRGLTRTHSLDWIPPTPEMTHADPRSHFKTNTEFTDFLKDNL